MVAVQQQASQGKQQRVAAGKRGKPAGAAAAAEQAEAPAIPNQALVAGSSKSSSSRACPTSSSDSPTLSRALLLQVGCAVRTDMPEPGPQSLKSMPAANMPDDGAPPASPREGHVPETQEEEAQKLEEADSTITAVVLMNIPTNYTRDMVISLLDKQGLASLYDFLYLPIDASSNENLGYFVINFISPETCSKFVGMYHGTLAQSCFPGMRTGQLCEVRTAAVQGKQANYDRVRLHNCFGLAGAAKTAGCDNVASRHVTAEAAALTAARSRAAAKKKESGSPIGEDRQTQTRKQIEWYFSSTNLGNDEYLRSLMDAEGWIELVQLIKFPRLKILGVSTPMAAASLVGSSCIEVSPDGKRVRHSNAILRQVFHSAIKERPSADAPKHGTHGMAASGLSTGMAASGLSTGVMESKVRQRGKDEVYF